MIDAAQLFHSKKSIETLLQISSDTHAEIVMDCGIGYCETAYGKDTAMFQKESQSKEFWQWFSRDWNKRNYELLCSMKLTDVRGKLCGSIEKIHIDHAFVSIHMNAISMYFPSKVFSK